MPGIRKLSAAIAIAAAVLVPFASPGVARAEAPPKAKRPQQVDVEKLLTEADQAEKEGKFDRALQLYLRAFTAGRTEADIRDHIRHCFRHVSQAERHRDPAFRQFVLTLQTSDALAVYTEAVEKIQKTYADRGKATVEKLFAAGLDELDAALSAPPFRQEYLKDASDAKVGEFRTALRDWRERLPATPREAAQAARTIVGSANKLVGLKNGAVVVFELLCGACGGLDEYSAYLPPGVGADTPPLAELAAYGLLVRGEVKGLVVEFVVPHSWAAAHTKLQKGDRIEKVNGKPVTGDNPAALAEALRAAEPTGHLIELAATDVQSVRLPTPLPTVYGTDLIDVREGVGYLRLAAFKDRTVQEFDDAVLELRGRGMKALVIDLRGNPGGLFTSAVEVAKRFVPAGPVTTTDGQVPDFANRVFSSDSGMAAHDFPVVLLVDTKTMSAAEILAASLKDSQRATLVGLPTFGKGLIQASIRLHALDAGTDDAKSGVLILSVATANGPLSGLIQGRGVSPHVIESNADRQLAVAVEKAIELLTGSPPPLPQMPPMPSQMPPMPRGSIPPDIIR